MEKICFKCKKNKPAKDYKENKMKYKRDSLATLCNDCVLERALREGNVLKYNFDINKFEKIEFASVDEIIKFLEK